MPEKKRELKRRSRKVTNLRHRILCVLTIWIPKFFRRDLSTEEAFHEAEILLFDSVDQIEEASEGSDKQNNISSNDQVATDVTQIGQASSSTLEGSPSTAVSQPPSSDTTTEKVEPRVGRTINLRVRSSQTRQLRTGSSSLSPRGRGRAASTYRRDGNRGRGGRDFRSRQRDLSKEQCRTDKFNMVSMEQETPPTPPRSGPRFNAAPGPRSNTNAAAPGPRSNAAPAPGSYGGISVSVQGSKAAPAPGSNACTADPAPLPNVALALANVVPAPGSLVPLVPADGYVAAPPAPGNGVPPPSYAAALRRSVGTRANN